MSRNVTRTLPEMYNLSPDRGSASAASSSEAAPLAPLAVIEECEEPDEIKDVDLLKSFEAMTHTGTNDVIIDLLKRCDYWRRMNLVENHT